jgi:ribosomal protein L29
MAKTKELKLKELRALSVEDAKEKLASLQQLLAKERATLASGVRPENPGRIRSTRKAIARLFTILTEKSKKAKMGEMKRNE